MRHQGETQKESGHAVVEKKKDSVGDSCCWYFDLTLLDKGKIVKTIYDTNHSQHGIVGQQQKVGRDKFSVFSSVRQRQVSKENLRESSEKAMAPHSSTLAWKIPWTEEPGKLQSMGSLRVRHDCSLSLFTFMHWRRKWQPTPVFLPGESQGREPGGLPSMGSHRVGHD